MNIEIHDNCSTCIDTRAACGAGGPRPRGRVVLGFWADGSYTRPVQPAAVSAKTCPRRKKPAPSQLYKRANKR